VVHDPFWTATARHADIVLPATMTVERDDLGVGGRDSTLFAMPQLAGPHVRAPSPVQVTQPLARGPAARGIADGSCVRIFNDRGSCLAGVTLTQDVRLGVVQLSTGAWYDPDPADPSFCRHGNPNVLTADRPSSALSQGTTGQLAMVGIEPYDAVPPDVSVHRPPVTAPVPAGE